MSNVIYIGKAKETEIEEIARRNKENEERIKRDRDIANERVKRSYRLKRRKPGGKS